MTSKRLRFEVFKRDGFTCQYCGRTPPGVVLEVDHILPSSKGGQTTTANLLTACHLPTVLEALDLAVAMLSYDRDRCLRYFCGICWRRIRGLGPPANSPDAGMIGGNYGSQ